MDDRKYIQRVIELAEESSRKGGFPAGALIVKDEKIISEGLSLGSVIYDPTSHAEIASIRDACKKLKTTNLSGATLYESVQSCVMCMSAANWAGIRKIVYAGRKTPEMISKYYYEGSTDNEVLNGENNRKIEMVFASQFEDASLKVIKEWEDRGGFNQKKTK